MEMKGRMKVIKASYKCDRSMDHTIDWEDVQDPIIYVGLLRVFFSKLKPPLMEVIITIVSLMLQENTISTNKCYKNHCHVHANCKSNRISIYDKIHDTIIRT